MTERDCLKNILHTRRGGPVSKTSTYSEDVSPKVINPNGDHPFVLLCEHASHAMPRAFDDLGLNEAQRKSHIAWDPGALATAILLAERLNAPLIHTSASRLIYDCNRPPDAPDAMPARSEATDIPGNRNLSEADRQARVETFYRPFEQLVSDTLDNRPATMGLVTVHSFTPVYLGAKRDVEIGILHDDDTRLADAMLDIATGHVIARNAPYGPEDGVTHSLKRHALPRGLLNVMLELRNDLIETPDQCADMAALLGTWIDASLSRLTDQPAQAASK